MRDIKHIEEGEEVVRIIPVEYSILTCRSCGKKEKIKGHVEIKRLMCGWGVYHMDTNDCSSVYEWLLCPDCVKKVNDAAGIK